MKTIRFLKKALPACLALACATPSCVVTWDTGGVVRKGATVCKGFDTLHPVGGKVYIGTDGASFYMQAQEVTYTTSPRLVKVNGTHGPKMGAPTPTGRTAWIQVKPLCSKECPPDIARKTGLREIPYYFSHWVYVKEVAALPRSAKLWNTGETFADAPTSELIGEINPHPTPTAGTTTKVLAAPLDYVVDPVLSTASSAGYAVALIGGAVTYVAVGFTACAVQCATFGLLPARSSLWESQLISPPTSPYDPETEACIVVEKRGASFMYAYLPRGTGKGMSTWTPTYLPAPYLRQVIDTGVPLVMSVHCPFNASEQDMEARLNAALAPLQAEGIRIHRATAENGQKRINITPGRKQ